MSWTVEFFADDDGRQPAREWLEALDSGKRAAAIAAIETYLTAMGHGVCATEHGKQLGGGLFEFRIRHDERTIRRKSGGSGGQRRADVLLRLFCHAYGRRVVLLLGGYDKGIASSARRQGREIRLARRRLQAFNRRQAIERRNRGA